MTGDRQEGSQPAKFQLDLSLPLYCLLFFSGLSALIYEVAWVRMLALAVGSTTQAASAVIATFLGGLALGGWLAGKVGDRIKVPHLVLYGILELSIALVAPIVSYFLHEAPSLFVALNRALSSSGFALNAERLLLSCLLLLPPTILMGATLPIVTALLAKGHARAAHYFSMLYGLNTLGAVVGSLTAAYLGFPYLGVTKTIFLAAGVNFLVSIAAFALAQSPLNKRAEVVAARTPPPDAEPASALLISGSQMPQKWLYAVAAFLGFTALSYEVLWIRLLKAFISSSTYAFTAMISTFLLGLVIGSILYNRQLQDKPNFLVDIKQQLKLLAFSQYTVALTSAIGLMILPGILVVVAAWQVYHAHGRAMPPAELLALEFVISFCLLILPASALGLSFPLIGGLAASQTEKVAKAVGNVYAANTLGCILGSLVCGLILIPTIGSQIALAIIVALTVATAIFIDLRINEAGRKPLTVVFSLLAIALFFLPHHYLEKMYVKLTNGKVIRASEDGIGRVLVAQYSTGKRLIVNGTSYSADTMPAMRYMRMLGHLPVLLHPQPQDALVVCFGVGTTAGAVAKHPEVRHLDICEISPAVLAGADIFTATNDGVVHKAKVACWLEDGRNYLLRTPKRYDVISFEPPPPCDAGVVNLYSKEFYQLCRQRLNAGGMLCQWIPMHLESKTLWKMMVKTMAEVFPYVTVWAPSSLEAIMIGSDRPIAIDLTKMRERIQKTPAVNKSLMEVGLNEPEQIAATYILGGSKLNSYVAGCSAVTDDHPSLEFFLPYPGPLLSPIDLEPYASGVDEILITNPSDKERPAKSPQLLRNLIAVHELREAANCSWQNNLNEAKVHLAKALGLVPDNKYFQWARTHPGVK